MLCETFSLTLSSIASTNGDLLGFIFLTLLPIRNPQNKYKTKTVKPLHEVSCCHQDPARSLPTHSLLCHFKKKTKEIPLIEDISKFPILKIKSKIKIQKGKTSLKIEAQLRNSLKIDLSSSLKTQRSELISSLTGWFAVIRYLISDDKQAVDSWLQVCLSLFVSRQIMEITLISDSTRYNLLRLFISLHFNSFTRILYLEKLFEMNRLCLSFYLF